jgi:ligand-binding sensor domain-containing protein
MMWKKFMQKTLPQGALSLCLFVGTELAFSQTLVWQRTSGPDAGAVRALAINSNGAFFAGTDGGGVFRSPNSGANWTAVNFGLSNLHVFAVVSNSPGHIFAGTNGGGVSRSVDDGENWLAVNTGLTNAFVWCLAINASDDIFAGTFSGGIFRSLNGGASWTALNTGLINTAVSALAINSAGQIFAGTAAGMISSTDNGEGWRPANAGLTYPDVRALAINPVTRVIFAGTGGGGVFRSMDGGGSWTAVNSGLTIRNVYTLAINSLAHIFAGGRGGIFRSTNNGGSWAAVNSGLTDTDVRSLVINSKGYIFTGTFSGAVFRSTQSTTAVKEIFDGLPISFSLEQNYPNPFWRGATSPALSGGNPSTTIRFDLPRSGYVTLKVYNLLGEEVATLLAENYAAGKHQMRWDASGWPSGVYVYRLQLGESVQAKKFVLLGSN